MDEERAQLADRDICCECGESVAPGSGRFVNRVPVLDDYDTRMEMNKPYPQGAWMCAECDAACPLEDEDEYELDDSTNYHPTIDDPEFSINGTLMFPPSSSTGKEEDTVKREARAIVGLRHRALLQKFPLLKVTVLDLSLECGWLDYSIEGPNEIYNIRAREWWRDNRDARG